MAPGFSTDTVEVRRLTALCRAAAARDLAVDALSGDDSWVLRPQVAVDWAAEVHRSRLFDRVHLDVEPHARPDWSTDGPRLRAGMLDMLTRVAAVGPPVDLDIPFWYGRFTTGDGDRFDRVLMRRASGVTVLAYRDDAAAVLAVASTCLDAAAEIGVPAWVGINTGDPGGDPPSTSYRGATGGRIRSEMRRIESGGAAWTSFAGVAVHHFDSLPEVTGTLV